MSMNVGQFLLVALAAAATIAVACMPCVSAADLPGHSLIHTNIAIVGADENNMKMQSKDGVMIDPSNLIGHARAIDSGVDDIEEDPEDRFITSRSGKLRPIYNSRAEDWANDAPVGSLGRILLRKKRCGGGGGGDDDDDGDADRSRRSRRARRTRRVKKVKKKKNKSATKTVTRKIIQNGQVVSQTTDTQNLVAQPVATVVEHQQVAPVVHTVSTHHTIQVQAHPTVPAATTKVQVQPEVIQTNPVVVQQAVQPAVVQPAVQPAVVQQTVPAQAVVQATN